MFRLGIVSEQVSGPAQVWKSVKFIGSPYLRSGAVLQGAACVILGPMVLVTGLVKTPLLRKVIGIHRLLNSVIVSGTVEIQDEGLKSCSEVISTRISPLCAICLIRSETSFTGVTNEIMGVIFTQINERFAICISWLSA